MNGTTPFFRPGGTMDPNAPSYIERAADAQLFEALARGEYVFLLDSRQKGKSSMVARAIVKLRQRGISTVKLDLQRLGSNVTPEQWYAGLIGEIGAELGLTNELFQYWGDRTAVGPLARWIGAMKDVVLKKTTAPLVVFIDEIDFVRALPFPTDEFFAGIRDCYNRRSENCGFERLTFCLIGVATPGQLIRNPEITPFNIGQRIDVSDFTLADSKPFAEALSLDGRNGNALLARVHHWLSGHPYLTQLLCSRIAADSSIAGNSDVDRLVKSLFLTPESRQREPNFADVERRMLDPDVPGLSDEEKRTQALELYGRVLKGKRVDAVEENPIVATLRLSGIGLEDRSTLRIRNRLYSFVFDEKWRRQSMPDAELRRQRGAARLALIRATAVAGAVVLGVTAVALNMNRLANDRSKALTDLGKRTTQLDSTAKERKSALEELTRKNNDLDQLSRDRQSALMTLRGKTNELQEVSEERAKSLKAVRSLTIQQDKTIAQLNTKSDDLDRQTYNTLIGKLHLAARLELSETISPTFDKLENVRYRNWEWGYLRLLAPEPILEASLDRASWFEFGTNGVLRVATPKALYEVHGTKLIKLREHSPPKDPEVENWRADPQQRVRGTGGWVDTIQVARPGFRVWQNSFDYRSTLCRADDNKVIIASKNGVCISDIDPKRRLYIYDNFANPNVFEVRSLDDHRVIASHKGLAKANISQFLPDGTVLSYYASLDSKSIWIERWDLSGRTLAKVPNTEPYWDGGQSFAIAPDGKTFAACYGGYSKSIVVVQIRNTSDLSLIRTIRMTKWNANCLEISPDGKLLAVGRTDGAIQLYEYETGIPIQTLLGPTAQQNDLAFTKDGAALASLTWSGDLMMWKMPMKPAYQERKFGDSKIWYSMFTGDGKFQLTMLDNKTVVRKNLATGDEIERDFTKTHKVVTLASAITISSKLNVGYVALQNGTILEFDVATLKTSRLATIFPGRPFTAIRFNDDSRLFCRPMVGKETASEECAIVDSRTFTVLSRSKCGSSMQSFGRNLIATYTGDDKEVTLWQADSGKWIHRLKFEHAIWGLKLSPDETLLAIGTSLGPTNYDLKRAEIRLYDTRSGKQVGSLYGDNGPWSFLNFSPNGHYLTARNQMAISAMWHVPSRRFMAELSPRWTIVATNYSRDSERLVTLAIFTEFVGGEQAVFNTLQVYDCRTAEEILSIEFKLGPDDPATRNFVGSQSAAFSRDGRTIVVVGRDNVLRQWNTVDWKRTTSKPVANK